MQKITIIVLSCVALSISSCKFSSTDQDKLPGPQYSLSDIRIVDIDGTNQKILVNGRINVRYANFLPNGQKIIYVQTAIDGGEQSLYSMNPDGSGKTFLTILNSINFYYYRLYPDTAQERMLFTPDSRSIIYIASSAGPSNSWNQDNVYRIASDGSANTNLTQNYGNARRIYDMALSADGQQIVYGEYDLDQNGNVTDNEYRLCMINIDGSNKKIIKKSRDHQLLYPQFLQTDKNVVIYVARSIQIRDSSAIRSMSVADTSLDRVIITVGALQLAPVILSQNKMVYTEFYNPSFYMIDLTNGSKQNLMLPFYTSLLKMSLDRTMLLTNSGMTLWSGQPDGSNDNKITVSPYANYIFQLFLSPDKKKIIYCTFTWQQDWS
jgi:hypothetical protein